jgi:glycosyltransferase involved in cell wall biosynthesis
MGFSHRIHWHLDYVPNEWVATLMAISDVVVLPYRAITQSGVLQVAYACGKPVVGTRIGGLPDVIHAGETGLLADPHDPPSLANTIIEMLTNPEKVKQMGLNARRLAETQYSWLTVAGRIKAVFERIIQESSV